MNKLIAIGVLSLATVTGVVVLLGSNNSNTSLIPGTSEVVQTSNNEEFEDIEANPTENVSPINNSGLGYVLYSEQTLKESSDSKRIVFFHAPWCSTCNFYERQIEQQGVPADVTILKVDYDSETALKQKYDVTIQSTFVLLDNDGDVVKSWPFARGLSGIQDLYEQV